jgi:glycogen operon protein
MALLALSHGVPMFVGGDERLRSLQCNNNPYNLDSPGNWQRWDAQPEHDAFERNTRAVFALRAEEPVLRARQWLSGKDEDGNGLLDVELLAEDASRASAEMLNDSGRAFLAWRFDAEGSGSGSRSLFIAYNWGDAARSVTLPAPASGFVWHLLVNTAQEEPLAPMSIASNYTLAARSIVVLAERSAASGAP